VKAEDQSNIRKQFMKPVEITYWVGVLLIILLTLLTGSTSSERQRLVLPLILAGVFGLVYFHWISSLYGTQPWVHYSGAGSLITAIALYSFVYGGGAYIGALFITVIASVGVIAGSRIAFRIALFAAAIEIVFSLVIRTPSSDPLFTQGMHAAIVLIAGYITSQLSGIIHEKISYAERQTRYITTLLKVGIISSQPEELESTFPQIAEMIAREVPVTSCQISLLDENGDHLVIRGAYPIRPLEGWDLQVGQSYPVCGISCMKEVLETGKYQILNEEQIRSISSKPNDLQIFVGGTKNACLLPMAIKGKSLGVIVAGEERHWNREPFTKEKIAMLQTLANQISSTLENARLFQEAQRQANRLAVINEVARAIGSTIELEDLLELIYEQLSKVIPSDTYYLGLYDPTEDVLTLEITIDNGERFPRTVIPPGKGFSRWVIENRQPLLIHHISQENHTLPAEPFIVGQDRISESWLGVPLLAGERTLGILAMASYSANAFDDEDMTLLRNVAAQAALAVDNARQHAEVKEQARRDSLTGAYNHGNLLSMLDEAVEDGRTVGTPVSLIMMDIDYFKEYNDQYGHVFGDKVLRIIVQSIQSHVKRTDIVGKWGGEEFAIGLPGATLKQALDVARRIQKTLSKVALCDQTGQNIPTPTLSQGIATFPQHAGDTAQLVDIADMALYRAKNLGRDQIVVANGSNGKSKRHVC
jgi:diguanylate cyclase (GGDEF)-like protein